MFAYVVMSYERPDLVSRLAHRLRASAPSAEIVIRHDTRACAIPDDLPEGCHRRPSDSALGWGHWSMVEAMLVEIAYVLEHTDASHIVFVSGRDYPAQPLEQWQRRVEQFDVVGRSDRLDFTPRWGRRRGYVGDETAVRHRYRWFTIPTSARWKRTTRLWRNVDRVAFRVVANLRPVIYYRHLPRGRGTLVGVRRRWTGPTAYKSWPWLVVSRRAAELALERTLEPLYRRALIPEEGYFATTLRDASLQWLAEDVTFTTWPDDASASHPRTLYEHDVDAIIASGLPFARKTDTTPLLDLLDLRNTAPDPAT